MMVMRGSEIERVDTSQAYPLGAKSMVSPQEMTDWTGITTEDWGEAIYVEFTTASVIGRGFMQAAGATTRQVRTTVVSASPGAVVGVAQHVNAINTFGWLLRDGLGKVLADTGGITADTGLIPGNAVAGAFDDVATAATDATCGTGLAAILATATGNAYIHCTG